MNLRKELQKLPMDSLVKALGKMSNAELLGLAKPIASTPRSLRGDKTREMYLLICDEIEHRNPDLWVAVVKDLDKLEARAARMDTFIAPFKS
jgi:hypothetical protein